MNWEAIGAVGEIVGAVAVILTLIYLAAQIRQNTNSVRAAAVDAAITHVSNVRETIFVNADIAEIEPPRVCRRPFMLRGYSNGKIKQIFPGSAGTRRSYGGRAGTFALVTMGHD
jgi:hypothetical protein